MTGTHHSLELNYFEIVSFPIIDEFNYWKVVSCQFEYAVQDELLGGYIIEINFVPPWTMVNNKNKKQNNIGFLQ